MHLMPRMLYETLETTWTMTIITMLITMTMSTTFVKHTYICTRTYKHKTYFKAYVSKPCTLLYTTIYYMAVNVYNFRVHSVIILITTFTTELLPGRLRTLLAAIFTLGRLQALYFATIVSVMFIKYAPCKEQRRSLRHWTAYCLFRFIITLMYEHKKLI